MANPFFNMGISQNNFGNMSQMKSVFNMLKGSNNVQQVINNMAMQNPQVANVINMARNSGNYEQMFRNICQQRGINPDEFLRQLNS